MHVAILYFISAIRKFWRWSFTTPHKLARWELLLSLASCVKYTCIPFVYLIFGANLNKPHTDKCFSQMFFLPFPHHYELLSVNTCMIITRPYIIAPRVLVGAIVGGVIGGVVLICLLILAGIVTPVVIRSRKEKIQPAPQTEEATIERYCNMDVCYLQH